MNDKSKIFHQFALDDNNQITYIDNAIKGRKYYCPLCKNELNIRKGKIRIHHFAHKNENNCNYETYLHQCAKYLIKNAFDNNAEFSISYIASNRCPQIDKCKFYKDNYFKDCNGEFENKLNLKNYYDLCSVEYKYNGFTADVSFHSNINVTRPPIFVEIYNTHRCTEGKLHSGIRIIEIKIQTYNELVALYKKLHNYILISENDTNLEIYFYNFKRDLSVCRNHKFKMFYYNTQTFIAKTNNEPVKVLKTSTQIKPDLDLKGEYNITCNEKNFSSVQCNYAIMLPNNLSNDVNSIYLELINNGILSYYNPCCKVCRYQNNIQACLYQRPHLRCRFYFNKSKLKEIESIPYEIITF